MADKNQNLDLVVLLKRNLDQDCQDATDAMNYAETLRLERERVLAYVKALDLPASHKLRKKLFK